MSGRAERILRNFEERRASLDSRVQTGIEVNRKGAARLEVTDASGRPVERFHAEIQQKTHDFKFGANCFMLGELETEAKNQAYEERFGHLFNMATLPFYWNDLEPEQGRPRFDRNSDRIYRRPAPDLCLEFCDRYGVEPKLHCLNYDPYTPLWVEDDVTDVKRCLDRRFHQIAERYADRIRCMEVINETLCGRMGLDLAQRRHGTCFYEDPEIVEWSFEHARKYLPANELVINEAMGHVWGPAFMYNRSAYYMQIERALKKGASIDGIGMQFHMFYRAEDEEKYAAQFYNMDKLFAVMDRYADFGRPLQVTEMTIPAYSWRAEDEYVQAEIMRELYSIWFSHPAMEAIIYWNLVDGYAAFAQPGDMASGENYYYGGLMRFDMTPKPAYEMLDRLIHETWHTGLSLDGAAGRADFRGFYGHYSLTVTADGRTVTKDFHLKKGVSNKVTVVV